MAMGRRTRDEAERSIRNRRPFTNSTGSMRGTRGSTRDLGWLSSHSEARKIKDLLSRAEYVVWSYDTPIGFVSADEDGMETNYYVDESHSATTSQHQSILRVAFSDFETIGERRPARRPRRVPQPVNQAALDRANATVAGYAEAARREPTAAHVYAHQAGQQASIEQMLDPRYGDPDWTPWRGPDLSNLPPGAEERDAQRVEREGTWRP